MGKLTNLLKSPKKEDQQLVPDITHGIDTLEELKGFLGITNNPNDDHDEVGKHEAARHYEPHCELMMNDSEAHEFEGWDISGSSWEVDQVFPTHQETGESFNNMYEYDDKNVTTNNKVGNYVGFWDECGEESKSSLNLNLNYEEVLQAWSNRAPLWAHHPPSNLPYLGEVPNLEDERARRETRVLRYKEKRQNRLFSKKIRYEVRKLNADKRPRLKGRFVKRMSDNDYEKIR